ncbi:T9SS type A sorting domain-containing protein [bacterium]|nr:T9SS type A sorting domain-containing protein [bacterium]
MKTKILFFNLLIFILLSSFPNSLFSQKNWTWYIKSINIESEYIEVTIGIKANSSSDVGILGDFELIGTMSDDLYDFGEMDPFYVPLLTGAYTYVFSGSTDYDDWYFKGTYGSGSDQVIEAGLSVVVLVFYIKNSEGSSNIVLNKLGNYQETYESTGSVASVTYNNSGGDVSLPVQMAELTAAANRENGITIAWRTESETNCAGFHVWRSESETGIYTCITTDLIPGQGNQSIAHDYTFIDKFVQNGIVYWYKIEEISTTGENNLFGPISVMGISPIPDTFNLSPNYPNPFNPETAFAYQIPEDCDVSISIYTILGQEIKSWIYKNQEKGYYEVKWDGSDYIGKKVPSGIYLLKMQAVDFSKMIKMTVIR